MYYFTAGKSKVHHWQISTLVDVAIVLAGSNGETVFSSMAALRADDVADVLSQVRRVKVLYRSLDSLRDELRIADLMRIAMSLEAFIQADKGETDASLMKKVSIEVNAWEVNRRDPDGLFAFVYDCAEEQGIDMSLLH